MQKSPLFTRTLFFSLAIAASTTINAQSLVNDSVVNATNQATGFFISVNTLPPLVGGVDLGYQFTPYIGLQAGVQGIWGTLTGFDVDTAAIYDVALRGVAPLGSRFELFGKIGVGILNATQKITLPILNYDQTVTSERAGLTYGLGLGYCFTPRWMLAAQVTGIDTSGSQVIKSGFKAVPTISLTYHFAE